MFSLHGSRISSSLISVDGSEAASKLYFSRRGASARAHKNNDSRSVTQVALLIASSGMRDCRTDHFPPSATSCCVLEHRANRRQVVRYFSQYPHPFIRLQQ